MITNEKGLKIAKLYHVSVENGKTSQSNKFYFMEMQPDGTTKCEWGRVGGSPKITILAPGEFDKVYREKIGPKKGYSDHTELLVEKTVISNNVTTKTGEVIDISCSFVKSLFNDLMAYANKSIKQNYTVSQEAVTEAQVNAAQELLDSISKEVKMNADIKAINEKLLRFYSIIPRAMKDVRHHLISILNTKSNLDHAQSLLTNEQNTLDTMAGQVQLIKQQREANKLNEGAAAKKVNLLDQMGLNVTHVTDAKVIAKIKSMMGSNANQLKKVFAVTNSKTQAIYDNNLKKAANKKSELFWHGSRNENIFNILQTGLLLKPVNVATNGKMFGFGSYFADKFQKSLGYTSLRGSYWTSGSDNKAYLILFEVHVGEQHHIHRHDSSCYDLSYNNLRKKGNYDSVFAHGGADLRNNEYIVYKEDQCTIKYLIEVS